MYRNHWDEHGIGQRRTRHAEWRAIAPGEVMPQAASIIEFVRGTELGPARLGPVSNAATNRQQSRLVSEAIHVVRIDVTTPLSTMCVAVEKRPGRRAKCPPVLVYELGLDRFGASCRRIVHIRLNAAP